MKIKERIQKRIDAFLLRKAKKEAKKKIADFLKPPEVKLPDEFSAGKKKNRMTKFHFALVTLAEHFSVTYLYSFFALLSILLEEETKLKRNQKQ